MPKVAVLLPCYNEALTIEKVVRDFRKELPEADIWVYDNNSSDGSAELALTADRSSSSASPSTKASANSKAWPTRCFPPLA